MSLHTALVKIEEEKISSEKAKKFIASEKNGAESIFIGKVRNENSGKNVSDTNSQRGCGWNTKRKNAEDVRKLRRSPITGYWNSEPNVGRVANGIPNRVDRLRGLGNAVVPQVVEYLGRCVMEYENDQ